jgi:hypothetical protein
MSTTEESLSPSWRPEGGDLEIWYRTLEVYAASATPTNVYFHGPHIAVPVSLRRVEEGLRWLETRFGTELNAMPLPTLGQMRTELKSRRGPTSEGTTLDSGSPCHNLWHWINGS